MRCLSGIMISVLLLAFHVHAATLEESFLNPPDSAKPHTWWHWLHGNVSQEGITADLEAMKKVGLGGFQAFHISRYKFGDVPYMSDEWHRMMKHTIQEADRLGLEMCFNNCAGWSAVGGPWITPEYAMQKVVWTETQVEGPGEFSGTLERSPVQKAYRRHRSVDYYQDIAVVAVPTPQSEREGTDGFRIDDWRGKADFDLQVEFTHDTRDVDEGDLIRKDKVVVLTSEMDEMGNLNWKIPEGKWTIFRFGYAPTGVINHPAPPEGEGLECDKLSKEAVEFNWKHSIQKIIEDAGPHAGKAFNRVLVDSYEVGTQNWTRGFEQEFEKRMGYAITPYLPVLTGRVVGSMEISERFLWDFRRVIADLFAENFYGHFAELCHRNRLKFSAEPYGRGNFDELAIASKVDIPMGEFWTASKITWYDYTPKLVSSVAHTTGKKYVEAESFTTKPPESRFELHPYLIKAEGDYFYCQGINRFVFHSSAHQPWKNVKPGMTMGHYGLQFHRNNTWFEKASGWVNYLTRCQFLLQEGLFAADLCYLVSEDAPNRMTRRPGMNPVPPDGYDYDLCSAETLMKMTVKDGRICLPNGMNYSLLILPSGDMRPAVLEKIAELVQAGAAVYGDRPGKSPSLVNYPACDDEIRKLAGELWGGRKIIFGIPLEKVLLSKGILPDFEYSGIAHEDPSLYAGKSVETIHRNIDGADVYFISNQHQSPKQITATFRVNGMQPELWFPNIGKIKETPLYSFTEDGRTELPLSLDAAGSVFVVFRKPAQKNRVASVEGSGSFEAGYEDGKIVLTAMESGPYEIHNADGSKQTVTVQNLDPMTLTGSWTLRFPPGWGAPAQIEFPELIDWTQHTDYDIQHFSGTAVYNKTFDIPNERIHSDERIFLDLGPVHVMAQVKLNGNDLGILWEPPFRVEITDAVQSGENRLEIEVVNLWVNRMVGDEKYPEYRVMQEDKNPAVGKKLMVLPKWVKEGGKPESERKTFATWKWFKADEPLRPSGLIGPVQIIFAEKTGLE